MTQDDDIRADLLDRLRDDAVDADRRAANWVAHDMAFAAKQRRRRDHLMQALELIRAAPMPEVKP